MSFPEDVALGMVVGDRAKVCGCVCVCVYVGEVCWWLRFDFAVLGFAFVWMEVRIGIGIGGRYLSRDRM